MNRLAATLLAVLSAVLGGCPADPTGLGPNPLVGNRRMPGRIDPNDARSGTAKPGRYVLVARLRLVTIEVPVGTASGSEEIWSYLDEEPVSAIRSASLGRNGLRVGLGREDSWPDLARIFKRMTGRSPKQNLVVAVPGDPLPIVLKERQQIQTIFTFYDDRTLSGADYPPGDNVLAVVCTLNEDDLSKLMITVMPQVRSTRHRTRFVMGQTGPRMVSTAEVFNFPHLTFRLTVPSKDFLVIGPGAHSRRPTSVGHHFLVKKKEGMEFETLLVLIPEVFAAPARSRRGGG